MTVGTTQLNLLAGEAKDSDLKEEVTGEVTGETSILSLNGLDTAGVTAGEAKAGVTAGEEKAGAQNGQKDGETHQESV